MICRYALAALNLLAATSCAADVDLLHRISTSTDPESAFVKRGVLRFDSVTGNASLLNEPLDPQFYAQTGLYQLTVARDGQPPKAWPLTSLDSVRATQRR